MDNIKISVIVPVYNSAEYIQTTLDSIINQDFDCYEIIVVDDGSSDNSLDLAYEKLKDTEIPHKIIHQRNSGVSVARNHGIEVSRGEYLVFVDSDDYILTDHLSNLYNLEYDFSLTQVVKKDGENLSNPYIYDIDEILCEKFIEMELNMQMPFNFFQLSYKSSIVKDNNICFSEGVVYGEDTEFALKALSLGDKIAISNDITYYYIQHPTSAIRTTEFKRFEVVEVFENLAEFFKQNGKDNLADLIFTSRIPKAIFGNMNYFFFNSYDIDEVINKMKELDLFNKLSKFKGDKKFELKIKLFLFNPKLYYKVWMKLKNSID